jgi:intracellular sulfur oxidation DsrE/DsrF family protein
MRKKVIACLIACCCIIVCAAQTSKNDSLFRLKDSTLRAKQISLLETYHQDSIKIENEFANRAKWAKLESKAQFPLLKAGTNSGVIPVENVTEIPDPNIDYKILFELVITNPDSAANEINFGFVEIARQINLHVASGIPIKKIKPVIVVHGPALNALLTNDAYRKKFKLDNPNIALINDLQKMGASIIACGQAMAFFDVQRESLLPAVKVSLTAQTVLTHYQLKGYVWRRIDND